MDVERLPAGRFERANRFAAALVQEVADRDAGAGRDHEPRGLGADAARRAG
jgi:hypothetical protein